MTVRYYRITPSIDAYKNMLRGYYMKSVISADTRSKCVGCGRAQFSYVFFNSIEEKKNGIKVPKCDFCGNYPEKFRIRRSLPLGLDGKADRVDIRHDKSNQRLTDIYQTIALIKIIDQEIESTKFTPDDYRSAKHNEDFKFQNFIDLRYWPIQEKKLSRGELTPSGLINKRTSLKHLKKYFSDVDIRNISSGLIVEFYENFNGGDRTRVLALQELRVILNYAFSLETIQKIPVFPKLKKPRIRDAENFLDINEQRKVISAIENNQYRLMIEIMAIYAMRTCEIRALQWQDIDFKNGLIKIQRHFSKGNTLIDMRKSNDKAHLLPITERFRELMNEIPFSINRNDFVFKGKEGSAVGEKVLSNAWKKALTKTGMRAIDLYEGIRHSRVSALLEKGYSEDQVMLLSGHETKDAFRRYGQLKAKAKLNLIREMTN